MKMATRGQCIFLHDILSALASHHVLDLTHQEMIIDLFSPVEQMRHFYFSKVNTNQVNVIREKKHTRFCCLPGLQDADAIVGLLLL